MGNIKDYLELAETNWYKPIGLIFAIAAFVIFMGTFLSLAIKTGGLFNSVILIVGIACIIVIWFWTRRYPKTKRGQIGFVVSIKFEDDEEKKKVKEDFIVTLRDLLGRGGRTKNRFQLIQVPDHITETTSEKEDIHKLRVKCKAHFVLSGRVRLREVDGKKHHFLNLEGAVSHRPIPKEIGSQFAREFTELFPRRLQIAQENDILTFEFASEWIELVARYIIGITVLISGDLDFAEELFNEANERLSHADKDFPIYRVLDERIPLRISEINEARAIRSYESWKDSRDDSCITELKLQLDKISEPYNGRYGVLQLRAIEQFLSDRDVDGALETIKKCGKIPEAAADASWQYSFAFLNAYQGNLQKAIQSYRKIAISPGHPSLEGMVEEFICWLLSKEPEKYQFYYCLGFINWKIKGDYKQAVADFEKFLSLGNDAEFKKERELAATWIEEIKEALKVAGEETKAA